MTSSKLNFGGYVGQIGALRKAAREILDIPAEEVADMTDSSVEREFESRGYIPVVISEWNSKDDRVYVIKQEVLTHAIILDR